MTILQSIISSSPSLAGSSFETHTAELAPSVRDLAELERQAQTSFLNFKHKDWVRVRWNAFHPESLRKERRIWAKFRSLKSQQVRSHLGRQNSGFFLGICKGQMKISVRGGGIKTYVVSHTVRLCSNLHSYIMKLADDMIMVSLTNKISKLFRQTLQYYDLISRAPFCDSKCCFARSRSIYVPMVVLYQVFSLQQISIFA